MCSLSGGRLLKQAAKLTTLQQPCCAPGGQLSATRPPSAPQELAGPPGKRWATWTAHLLGLPSTRETETHTWARTYVADFREFK